MKGMTIYSLAEELGMTPSMVSRAFNPDANIAPEKRELVLKTAEKYNYTPNRFASRMSMRTIRIGIILYYKAEHIREQMISGIENAYNNLRDYKIEYTLKCIPGYDNKIKECETELFKFSDYDGVIVSGFGGEAYEQILNRFAEINPNIVFIQNVCENAKYLFASKHDEALAAEIAAEILSDRLYHSDRKNVLLFTGDMRSSVHKNAKKAFVSACEKNCLNLMESFDMQDSEELLRELAKSAFEKYKGIADGIYITSGNSVTLCETIKKHGVKTSLVAFDVYPKLYPYIEDRTICASIFQNVSVQAEKAFSKLTEYLVNKQMPEKIIYTDVLPVYKSNMKLYR